MTEKSPEPELLPCPICGNSAFVVGWVLREIWCRTDRCLRLPARPTEAEAIAAWNIRLAGIEAGQRISQPTTESSGPRGVTGIHFNAGNGDQPFVKVFFGTLADAEAFHATVVPQALSPKRPAEAVDEP